MKTQQNKIALDFIKAIENNNGSSRREIVATFSNGNRAKYTTAIFWHLIADAETVTIEDATTGELLYIKEA